MLLSTASSQLTSRIRAQTVVGHGAAHAGEDGGGVGGVVDDVEGGHEIERAELAGGGVGVAELDPVGDTCRHGRLTCRVHVGRVDVDTDECRPAERRGEADQRPALPAADVERAHAPSETIGQAGNERDPLLHQEVVVP